MSKREDILAAATTLFAQKGYTATSTTEIVERAGVAQGTLFYHFKHKEGILLAILEEILNEYLRNMESIIQKQENGLASVEELIRSSIHFRQSKSVELMVLMRDFPADLVKPDSQQMAFIVQFFERLHGLFKCFLEKGQADGTIRKLDADKYAHILLGMLSGLDRHVLLSPMTVPDLTEESIDFCLDAISSTVKKSSLIAGGPKQ